MESGWDRALKNLVEKDVRLHGHLLPIPQSQIYFSVSVTAVRPIPQPTRVCFLDSTPMEFKGSNFSRHSPTSFLESEGLSAGASRRRRTTNSPALRIREFIIPPSLALVKSSVQIRSTSLWDGLDRCPSSGLASSRAHRTSEHRMFDCASPGNRRVSCFASRTSGTSEGAGLRASR